MRLQNASAERRQGGAVATPTAPLAGIAAGYPPDAAAKDQTNVSARFADKGALPRRASGERLPDRLGDAYPAKRDSGTPRMPRS